MSVTARAFDSFSARETWHSANETGTMLEDSHRNDRNHQSTIGYERGHRLRQQNDKSLSIRFDALGIAKIAQHHDPVSPGVCIE